MSHSTHAMSILLSVIRAGDDLRISFADTSALKRGILQLKEDSMNRREGAVVTLLRPRSPRRDRRDR